MKMNNQTYYEIYIPVYVPYWYVVLSLIKNKISFSLSDDAKRSKPDSIWIPADRLGDYHSLLHTILYEEEATVPSIASVVPEHTSLKVVGFLNNFPMHQNPIQEAMEREVGYTYDGENNCLLQIDPDQVEDDRAPIPLMDLYFPVEVKVEESSGAEPTPEEVKEWGEPEPEPHPSEVVEEEEDWDKGLETPSIETDAPEEKLELVYENRDKVLESTPVSLPITTAGKRADIQFYDVESSNLSAIAFREKKAKDDEAETSDDPKGTLFVRFKKGTIYRYGPISMKVYQQIIEGAMARWAGLPGEVGTQYHRDVKVPADAGAIHCQRYDDIEETWVKVQPKGKA